MSEQHTPQNEFARARAYIAAEMNARGRLSQCGRILKPLLDADGREVSLKQILALGIVRYGARILELRQAPYFFHIENRVERVNGVAHSFYRLVDSPAPSGLKPVQEQATSSNCAPSTSDEVGQASDWFEKQTGRRRPGANPTPEFELTP